MDLGRSSAGGQNQQRDQEAFHLGFSFVMGIGACRCAASLPQGIPRQLIVVISAINSDE
jgi:hypothetical protein